MAAVLTGGPGAVLSHRSACAAWDLCRDWATRVDITVTGERCHERPGVRVHRCKLDPNDVTVHRGVPITTPMRALLDFAEEVADLRQVTRAVEASVSFRLFDGRAMGALLDRSSGRRGVKPLRIVLGRYDESHVFTRSDLEDLLVLDLVNDHALPRPVVNAKVGEYEVDLLWREQKVVGEADSWDVSRHAGGLRARPAARRRPAGARLSASSG